MRLTFRFSETREASLSQGENHSWQQPQSTKGSSMRKRVHALPWVGLLALAWVALGVALVRAEIKPSPIATMTQHPTAPFNPSNS